MALTRKYVRDGERKIIGSVTSGFPDGVAVVRDEHNRYIGRTNERFETTRDAHEKLISTNSADPVSSLGARSSRSPLAQYVTVHVLVIALTLLESALGWAHIPQIFR